MKKNYSNPDAAVLKLSPEKLMVLSNIALITDPEGPGSFEGNWDTGSELDY